MNVKEKSNLGEITMDKLSEDILGKAMNKSIDESSAELVLRYERQKCSKEGAQKEKGGVIMVCKKPSLVIKLITSVALLLASVTFLLLVMKL